jgi:hypothetical protein
MSEYVGPAMPPASVVSEYVGPAMPPNSAAAAAGGEIGPSGPPPAALAAAAAAAAEAEAAAGESGKERRKKRPKKTRAARLKELRVFDQKAGLHLGTNVQFDLISTRHMDDQRFERAHKQKAREEVVSYLRNPFFAVPSLLSALQEPALMTSEEAAQSSTIDALVRMEGKHHLKKNSYRCTKSCSYAGPFLAAGLGQRTIADKLNDPNRPTWDEYKKDKKDQLDLSGTKDIKDMIKYRQELDAVRQDALAAKGATRKPAAHLTGDSDEDAPVGPTTDRELVDDKKDRKDKKKKDKKEKKKKKKKKDKKKKDKKRKRDSSGGSSDDDAGKFKLSNFMNASDSD